MSTQTMLETAKSLKVKAAALTTAQKNEALEAMAAALLKNTASILAENKADVIASTGVISPSMIDRLSLSPERIVGMATGLRDLISLEDPVGRIMEERTLYNGLALTKVAVPFGVVAIIYESRPNVTSDAAGLALKSGNVCVLRCGKEAYRSAAAIVAALQEGLQSVHLPAELVQLAESNRETSMEIMQAKGYVDLLIPRGGAGLINSCMEHARVPVIQTGTGICHIYVDKDADFTKALSIIENAKTSRPSVCNAMEVCLVDAAIASAFLPQLQKRIGEKVELRLDSCAASIIQGKHACAADFDTEFLDYVMAVAVVDGVDDAVMHIAAHSTHHSDGIVSENELAIASFVSAVDSAAVYVNASTRFTDGGEFGLGCEMGISTQKLHARGPMGLRELTAYKYVVRGNGQVR
ncbi:MAG TPA: glutamate-5-semialdehyde dehydrogenase [Methanocorpusculum sp.]|nr:glutamate-5-semialdehyde dehydrogenase [Methanocorpusculum sp.]